MTNTPGREAGGAGSTAVEIPSQLMELGVSMLRFSWAMTVFSAQQAANLVAGSASGEPRTAAHAFDAVSHAVEEQFGGVLRGAYKTAAEYLPESGRTRPEVAEPRG